MFTARQVSSVIIVLLLTFLVGCTRPRPALKLADPPLLSDDLPLEPLLEAIKQSEAVLSKREVNERLEFGSRSITVGAYRAGLKRFLLLATEAPSRADFFSSVRQQFDFYRVEAGVRDAPLLTGYYQPVIPGSLVQTAVFTQPLYRRPTDLLSVSLQDFNLACSADQPLRGRIEEGKIRPYFSRADIDSGQLLAGRGLELVWVEPIEAFFLQIQGSGTVLLPDGQPLRLVYADKNGLPYLSIGKVIKPLLPPGTEPALFAIQAFLRPLSLAEQRRYYNLNPSYVFFQQSEVESVTASGVPATAGRTVATDRRFFSKGTLAFLSFDEPQFASPDATVPTSYRRTSRFVLDQDVGGAITGSRIDLFCGSGDSAKQIAGVLKSQATLYYLVPKMDQQ